MHKLPFKVREVYAPARLLQKCFLDKYVSAVIWGFHPYRMSDPQIHCAYTKLISTKTLKPHPRNPNRHPESQIALLSKIIRSQGWRSPIVVSLRSDYVIKGHGRLVAAQLLGCKKVPVDFQEYGSEKEELADLIADNRLAELSEMDNGSLKDLLLDMDSGEFDMNLTGFEQKEIERLMTQFAQEELKDVEPQIEAGEDLKKKWKVKTGQIWQLGEHKLLCGDSTKKEEVEKLLGADAPNLMVTDPPYGVEYDPNWRNEAARKCEKMGNRKIGAGAVGKVFNDDVADWTVSWLLFPGNILYIWHAGKMASEVQNSILSAGFEIRSQIIWAKSNFAISRGDYHWKHEPCWYAVRKGKTGQWEGDRSQTTLWEIDKPQKSETGHSTQKPLECMARPIRNNSKPGEFIYDPFLGSGTTLIACENLKRKCLAIEISPEYVAIAIQRWSDLTGKEPQIME